MSALNSTFLYRMTHIDNVLHIIKYGVTHISSINANKNYVPIGDNSIISTRNEFKLSNNKKLGEYIPFYFGTRMPMLYVIQKGFNSVTTIKPENIVYCVTSVQNIIDAGLKFLFTNGHAIDSFTEYFDESHLNNIDSIIDKKALGSKFWKDDKDLDFKRRKEAEFLIESDLPASAIVGWVVFNKAAQEKLVQFGISPSIIKITPKYYF